MSGERGPALVVRRPGEVVLEERDVPSPGPGEVLIRPEVVGLCGTDLEIVDGQDRSRLHPLPAGAGARMVGDGGGGGHGAGGEGLAPGSRVVGEGIVPCGHCPRCRAGQTNLCLTYDELGFTRDGAAAGFVTVQRSLVHPLAPGVGAEDAALAEPASVVYRGAVGRRDRAGLAGAGGRGRHGGAAGGAAAAALVTGGNGRAGPPGGPGGARRPGRRGQVRDRQPGRRHRVRPGRRGGGQHRRGPVRARRGAPGRHRRAARAAAARRDRRGAR